LKIGSFFAHFST